MMMTFLKNKGVFCFVLSVFDCFVFSFFTLEIFLVKYNNRFYIVKSFNYTLSWLCVFLCLNLMPHVIWEIFCSHCPPNYLTEKTVLHFSICFFILKYLWDKIWTHTFLLNIKALQKAMVTTRLRKCKSLGFRGPILYYIKSIWGQETTDRERERETLIYFNHLLGQSM